MSFFQNIFFRKLFNFLKTVAGFIFLLVLTYLILNFEAFRVHLNFYFTGKNQITEQEYFSNIERVWSDNVVLEEKPVQIQIQSLQPLPSQNSGPIERQKKVWGLDDFNFEVYPNDDRIYIPKIGQNAPIAWTDIKDKDIRNIDYLQLENKLQQALQSGIVHYPGTAFPWQDGNTVFTGHSSYYPWAPGDYKTVFVLLDKVEVGDEVIIYYQQIKYTYKIIDKKIVKPTAMDVLNQVRDRQLLTLITCTPVGTDINRLVITAELK